MKLTLQDFQKKVWQYYQRNKRLFPWRETHDPYAILVSEFMLQQTQTDRVIPKYIQFLETFPTLLKLSQASFGEVYQLWQGLGYNRRAKYLLETAKKITTNNNGQFPTDIQELEQLPGIGHYTARAITTFAFNQSHVFIETNIRSAFIYSFLLEQEAVNDKEILTLVTETLDTTNPREWYYALMDYGVMIKTTFGNPNRKSKHYTKQSSFNGSNRQIRGNLLQLLKDNPLDKTTLYQRSDKPKELVDTILSDLVKEGLVVCEENTTYRLA